MSSPNFLSYHSYLRKESRFGFIYRRFILYPYLRCIIGTSFLDVGCGIGLFLSYGNNSTSLGLDVNPLNIKYLRSLGLRGKVIPDSGIFPVSDGSFSACISDQVLEHLAAPELFLNEISRSLTHNGCFLLGVPCLKGYLSDSDHKVYYTLDSIKQIPAISSNFTYLRHFYFPFNSKFLGRYLSFNYLYVLFRKTAYPPS